jgi:hypothetical protein
VPKNASLSCIEPSAWISPFKHAFKHCPQRFLAGFTLRATINAFSHRHQVPKERLLKRRGTLALPYFVAYLVDAPSEVREQSARQLIACAGVTAHRQTFIVHPMEKQYDSLSACRLALISLFSSRRFDRPRQVPRGHDVRFRRGEAF